MMRKICTFLLTLCACLLTACGGTGEATGRVVAMDVRDGEGLVSFTVETEKGEQIALELTEDTHIFSFIEGLDENITYEWLPEGVTWDPTDPNPDNPYYGQYD